jgi:hypothetical protein
VASQLKPDDYETDPALLDSAKMLRLDFVHEMGFRSRNSRGLSASSLSLSSVKFTLNAVPAWLLHQRSKPSFSEENSILRSIQIYTVFSKKSFPVNYVLGGLPDGHFTSHHIEHHLF